MYKTSLESVETSHSNPYIYYNMKLQAIIKSGMSRGGKRRCGGLHRGPNVGAGQAHASEHTLALISSRHRLCQTPTAKKFVTHTTCRDSLGLQEHETYLQWATDFRPVESQI